MSGESNGAVACPACRHALSFVVDSRGSTSGSSVRRRRQCLGCQGRFTTYESVLHPTAIVEAMERAAIAVRHARDVLEAVEDAVTNWTGVKA